MKQDQVGNNDKPEQLNGNYLQATWEYYNWFYLLFLSTLIGESPSIFEVKYRWAFPYQLWIYDCHFLYYELTFVYPRKKEISYRLVSEAIFTLVLRLALDTQRHSR
ncbi:Uncharacterised protein [Klebsiella michiganensis]|nr:Uncharacterised protein [Klebsiella michiganensis]